MSDKKYYWLKLKKDFFKRHDIKIIETMPNGKDYILFYLKLLCESLDHNGNLRFSDNIPYSEEMLSVITNTNVDVVRSAIKVFTELNMMEILDDKTIYMIEVNNMIGCETEWAEKKRQYRLGQKEDNVLTMSDKSKSIDKEIDKEIDKDKELDNLKENKNKENKPNNLSQFKVNEEKLRKINQKNGNGLDVEYIINHLKHEEQCNTSDVVEDEAQDFVGYKEVADFINNNNLTNLNPKRYHQFICSNRIKNWQQYLMDRNKFYGT